MLFEIPQYAHCAQPTSQYAVILLSISDPTQYSVILVVVAVVIVVVGIIGNPDDPTSPK